MGLLSRTAARLPDIPVPGLTHLVRAFLQRSFGEPPVREGPPGDEGLFGPASASWQLYGDLASLVGGIRSLLLQLTHPLAMAGVAEHSRYLEDPLDRLQHTSAYVALTTFGTTADALAIAERVRAQHRRVHGTAPDGRPYDAASPELLAWVSTTATDSFLCSDRAFGARPLPPARRDAFVAEQALAGALLDPRVDLAALRRRPDPAGALRRGEVPLPLIEEGWLPTTEAALRSRLDAFTPQLAVGAYGRECLRFLLWPPVDPLLRIGYLPTLAGALATLDARTLSLLGLPSSDPAQAVLRLQSEVALVALRAALARRSPSADRATARVAAA